MNRRGFLGALFAAPVAAVMAPASLAKQSFAAGGLITGSTARWGVVGEIGPEIINLPLRREIFPSMNTARLMQQQFNEAFGANDETDRRFDEMAGYCDEPVEVIHDTV